MGKEESPQSGYRLSVLLAPYYLSGKLLLPFYKSHDGCYHPRSISPKR